MDKKAVIIFSGYNPRAVVSFLRTLLANRITFYIVAKGNGDMIFQTYYAKYVVMVRSHINLDLSELLNCVGYIKKKYKVEKLFVAPSTEAVNRFLLCNRKIFEMAGCEIPLVEKTLYEEISDKYSFGVLCKQEKLKVPEEIEIGQVPARLPVVAKPRKYLSDTGKYNQAPVILKNKEELNLFLENNEMKEYYFQEFLEGESFYLLYYFGKDGHVEKFSQKNLMQQPDGKSILAAEVSDIHKLDISAKYEALLKQKTFTGLIMVELRKTMGSYYMIEANPRFWGPSQLFINAGCNFFVNLLADYGLMEKGQSINNINNAAKYYWKGGIVQTYKKGMEPVMLSRDKLDENWEQYDIYYQADTMQLFEKNL